MIIDSHCHAWMKWPYQPAVPDPDWRGRVEQLLHEMDTNGVERAVIVCAQIEHNPQNNEYIASQVEKYPGRLAMLADLDSEWSPTYHTPGVTDRLQKLLDSMPISGFTHYLRHDDDGAWLFSDEGRKLFKLAEKEALIASLSCHPHQQAAVRQIAQYTPGVPILCHHMGFVMSTPGTPEDNLNEVLLSARIPNIYLKVSGFAYASAQKWDFPYKDTHWILERAYEHFGAERLCWGSDYPVVRFFMTYRQAIEVFRTYCTFLTHEEKEKVLGVNLERLLHKR
jgi:L-fuconolactonase